MAKLRIFNQVTGKHFVKAIRELRNGGRKPTVFELQLHSFVLLSICSHPTTFQHL